MLVFADLSCSKLVSMESIGSKPTYHDYNDVSILRYCDSISDMEGEGFNTVRMNKDNPEVVGKDGLFTEQYIKDALESECHFYFPFVSVNCYDADLNILPTYFNNLSFEGVVITPTVIIYNSDYYKFKNDFDCPVRLVYDFRQDLLCCVRSVLVKNCGFISDAIDWFSIKNPNVGTLIKLSTEERRSYLVTGRM